MGEINFSTRELGVAQMKSLEESDQFDPDDLDFRLHILGYAERWDERWLVVQRTRCGKVAWGLRYVLRRLELTQFPLMLICHLCFRDLEGFAAGPHDDDTVTIQTYEQMALPCD